MACLLENSTVKVAEMMEKQKTLAKSAFLSGIALHTGARATMRMVPAPANTGIIFRRIDLPRAPEVRALANHVVDARRGTTIANGAAVVYTVEHVMAAFHAYGIDNAIVEMDGQELPIADGSSLPYVEMIEDGGVQELDAEAQYFTPDRICFVEDGGTKLVIVPHDKLEISCITSFKGCPFDPQYYEVTVTPESYRKELCGARTFVQYSDLQQLLAMGLARGGSLDVAAILHEGAIICKDELRYDNEIVRHKILDLIGDLFLCGRRVRGKVIAIKPGHSKNVELAGTLQKMIASAGA